MHRLHVFLIGSPSRKIMPVFYNLPSPHLVCVFHYALKNWEMPKKSGFKRFPYVNMHSACNMLPITKRALQSAQERSQACSLRRGGGTEKQVMQLRCKDDVQASIGL